MLCCLLNPPSALTVTHPLLYRNSICRRGFISNMLLGDFVEACYPFTLMVLHTPSHATPSLSRYIIHPLMLPLHPQGTAYTLSCYLSCTPFLSHMHSSPCSYTLSYFIHLDPFPHAHHNLSHAPLYNRTLSLPYPTLLFPARPESPSIAGRACGRYDSRRLAFYGRLR